MFRELQHEVAKLFFAATQRIAKVSNESHMSIALLAEFEAVHSQEVEKSFALGIVISRNKPSALIAKTACCDIREFRQWKVRPDLSWLVSIHPS